MLTLFASIIALRSPSPSPLNAGPRHSGRRISNRMTKFAFSSTLSPVTKLKSILKVFNYSNE